jgi:predicted acetyltransferase
MGYLASPISLGGTVTLRQATAADLDAIVDLSVKAHGAAEEGGVRHVAETEEIESWTVVYDDDHLVSTSVLMGHRLEIGQTAFSAGQIEYVATDPDYRRRGLVRAQFDVHHGRAADRGDLVLFIAGIPYFYKRLGYDYGLAYPRRYYLPTNAVAAHDGTVIDNATAADIPAMQAMHDRSLAHADVRIPRSAAEWDALVSRSSKWSEGVFVARRGREVVGWMRLQRYEEIASWELLQASALDLAAAETMLAYAVALAGQASLGILSRPDDAFGSLLESVGLRGEGFHALYARIPDARAFLQALRPELSRRLTDSPLAAEQGELTVSLYSRSLVLAFDHGTVTDVRWGPGVEDPGDVNGVGVAPDSLAELLLGAYGAVELAERVEDVVLGRHRALMQILFPSLRADVIGIL